MKHDFTPGRWAIIKVDTFGSGVYTLGAMRIGKVSDKLLYADAYSIEHGPATLHCYRRQMNKSEVVATADEEVAIKAVQKSRGIKGEANRRVTAAEKDAHNQLERLIKVLRMESVNDEDA